jgi:hypothetical protein
MQRKANYPTAKTKDFNVWGSEKEIAEKIIIKPNPINS